VSIRVALGAEPRMVKAQFVRHGLMLTCVGGVIGLVTAAGLSRWMRSLLFGITGRDPVTYAVAGGVILAAAMDPMETLRSE
jgi:putative ABC transport system permease protein